MIGRPLDSSLESSKARLLSEIYQICNLPTCQPKSYKGALKQQVWRKQKSYGKRNKDDQEERGVGHSR